MLTPLLAHVVTLLLPLAEPSGPTFNSEGFLSFILSKIIPAILGVIGVMMLLGARKQRMASLMEDVGKIIIIGAVLVGGGLLVRFGGSLASMIIN